ncbi:Fic family protein [Arcanobacterium wilhelmae]|uniref:Fic family protein n=1 Tax=Arcanobacterium wilhelmae TaxID=1803177 RepID=A0ABT9NCA6_9ACTO|nr:Fic/DOC family N-terminal domain-containing protein [Arcanobacterium wilhelmae]MDP9801138.1 Fic family protein [Arcanobacterium wilhelmae]WFN90491.1 Fic/DOC family N-terminal domain-containing protein [Arcanobacterium wilhelmae]
MPIDVNQPYQNLPALPPAKELHSLRLSRATIAAARALAQANATSQMLPNPSILIHAIPLLEAQASSEIENIVTTNDELFRAASEVGPTTPATREALRYRTALYDGLEAIRRRPLSINTAKTVCTSIRGIETDLRSGTGTFIGNPISHRRIYTPPEGKDVISGHLNAWEKFLHENRDFDPLVKLAMLHYQFEAIHPFPDGNGRTGRILNVLYLVNEQLLDLPVLYLSGYIVEHKDEYYRLLNGVTQDGAWEEWILFILNAVTVTSDWLTSLVKTIRDMLDNVIAELRATSMPARDLAHVLFEKPYLRYDDLMTSGSVSRPTATKWAAELETLGVLERSREGRAVVFTNRPYLELLFHTPLPR